MRAPLSPLVAPMLLALMTAACGGGPDYAALAPRPGEALDPRLPVAGAPAAPANAALAAEAAALVARARDAHAAFIAEAERAEPLLAAARGAAVSSEPWLAAQAALSALVRARGPMAMALGDLDRLASARVAGGGLAAGDLAALDAAMTTVAALDREDGARVAAWQAALGA